MSRLATACSTGTYLRPKAPYNTNTHSDKGDVKIDFDSLCCFKRVDEKHLNRIVDRLLFFEICLFVQSNYDFKLINI